MTTVFFVITAIVIVGAVFYLLRFFVNAYRRYRNPKVFVCPETGEQVAVKVDVPHVALSSAIAQPELRLQSCSHWPLRENCGQQCLLQIDSAPEGCAVRSVLAKWYRGKLCVYCGKPFDEIHLTDHKPALLNSKGEIIEWREVTLEKASEVLVTHMPVCWNCFIIQTFRRDHPDLVVDNPWVHSPRG